MSEIIDELLAGLATSRKTMHNQVNKIGEIMEKSNNILLQIETQEKKQTLTTTNNAVQSENVYNFSTASELALTKILEQFQQLMQQTVDNDGNAGGQSAMDCCLVTRQRVENLRSSARKLLALYSTITQLKQDQQQQLLSDDDKENVDAENT